MPDLMDRLYCSEQIHIPPTFPFIMKLYCKAAIRTQPYDLLKWSAAYFRALANGEEPPVKDRIEYPPYDSPTGLTPGYIKMLIKQLGKQPNTTVSAQTLFVKWNCVCLEDELLVKLLALMGSKTSVNWLKFVAVACGFISASLTNTMILVCELLTDEPEGGMATIPLDLFNELYTYLAYMDCGPLTEEEKKQLADTEMEEDASVIAEKIRMAVYEEEEGEREYLSEMPGEEERENEERGEEELPPEKMEPPMEERTASIRGDVDEETVEDGSRKGEDGESSDDAAWGEKEESKEAFKRNSVDGEPTEETSKELEIETGGSLQETEEGAETVEPLSKEPSISLEEKKPEGEIHQEREARSGRKIKLEEIEESIRQKIEEGLNAEDESIRSDEGFEELGSYLLNAAERVREYTAEEIGYRIFKKYARQEVPGIGPKIDAVEVEKVIDFMDYNSHKQEGMVMPRNIRHWMCPPLDKVPLPEP